MTAEEGARHIMAIIASQGKLVTGTVVHQNDITKPWVIKRFDGNLAAAMDYCAEQGWLTAHTKGRQVTAAGAALI